MNVSEIITDSSVLSYGYIIRDGYEFQPVTHPANIYDAIVIKNPSNVCCHTPWTAKTEHSLKEYIDLINQMKLEKAIVITNDISFITQCPTLQYLEILPPDDFGDNFDFSPLYEMPQIKSLVCRTEYGKLLEEFSSTVDYNKIKGIESLDITGKGHLNYKGIETLKTLSISRYKYTDLSELFSSVELDTLEMVQCKMKSLNGIEKSQKMQCLYLYYNKHLQDISALKSVSRTLKALHIENCPKIQDFSVLDTLDNLEMLCLFGKNNLPNLNFISKMKNLKSFIFSMNVEDGDLSPCLNLEYAYSERNRKHYNLKDKNLPKNEYIKGNENIEAWRCLE